MKRRLLASMIAAALATVAGSPAFAAEKTAVSSRYNIGDGGVRPVAATADASSDAAASAADSCAACDECNACDACGCSNAWFVEAEGLAWWRKSRRLPPLVTTSIGVPPQADAGVIGVGTTRVLFGDDNYEDGVSAGGRISFGRFLNAQQDVGIAASFFILDQEQIDFAADSSTNILAIPFFNQGLLVPAEGSLLLSYPGVSQNGRVNVEYQNDILGADVYVRKLLIADLNYRIDAIGGYQFSRVDDGLRINANYDDVAGLPDENFDITDVFEAQNEFHGASVGILAQADYGRWTVKGLAKCGLGNMHQTIDVSGQTVTTINGVSSTLNSGLFTQPSNVGSYENDEFGIIPEAKINVGYRLTDCWTVGVGYSFIYWNDLATANSALDRRVNVTQVPGPIGAGTLPLPAAPSFDNSDFWVQGLNFAAEFTY